MDFVKMEGLGNDFIVVWGGHVPNTDAIVRWCDRRFGVGADGVLSVDLSGPERIRMRYWNADGGEAEMCGNGLRCVARLAVLRNWVSGPWLVVETKAGDMPAEMKPGGHVRALVGIPKATGVATSQGARVHLVDIGNPHAVVFVDDPAKAPVATLGKKIEHDPQFPNGTNVEFVTPRRADRIEMRIWERGVGETLGSGTGATAAAFASVVHRGVAAPVRVELPGGELLIELDGEEAWMTGPANLVFEGTLPD
jgi:diaminopimelate epimerase